LENKVEQLLSIVYKQSRTIALNCSCMPVGFLSQERPRKKSPANAYRMDGIGARRSETIEAIALLCSRTEVIAGLESFWEMAARDRMMVDS
jgi:hypothetical protein